MMWIHSKEFSAADFLFELPVSVLAWRGRVWGAGQRDLHVDPRSAPTRAYSSDFTWVHLKLPNNKSVSFCCYWISLNWAGLKVISNWCMVVWQRSAGTSADVSLYLPTVTLILAVIQVNWCQSSAVSVIAQTRGFNLLKMSHKVQLSISSWLPANITNSRYFKSVFIPGVVFHSVSNVSCAGWH